MTLSEMLTIMVFSHLSPCKIFKFYCFTIIHGISPFLVFPTKRIDCLSKLSYAQLSDLILSFASFSNFCIFLLSMIQTEGAIILMTLK
jgi:hypothetical protein